MARKAGGTEQLEVAMERLKKAKTATELRAAQAIVLPLALGLSLEQTALAIGRSVGVTCRMRTLYDPVTGDEKKTTRRKCELRNRAKASLEQEARILDEVLREAAIGGVVIVPPLKPAVEARLGKPLALSTLYQMLARHGWRKLAPDKSHPQAGPAARDAWKKTPRAANRGSGGFCGPAPAAPNVSGRSTFRPHQRCAALLGQETSSPHGTCHADATIHLRLWRSQPAGWTI